VAFDPEATDPANAALLMPTSAKKSAPAGKDRQRSSDHATNQTSGGGNRSRGEKVE
jgi:hypothetical protein